MKRGSSLFLPLALTCLLSVSCAHIQQVVGIGSSPSPTDPTKAIALSVLSDSVYLVDPQTGQQTLAVQGLANFQAGYAVWTPDHRHLAYGNGGVRILDVRRRRVKDLNQGQSLSMPAWSPDGKRLAYGDGLELWVSAAGGSDPVRLALPRTLAPQAMSWRLGRLIVFQGLALDCNQPGPCVSTDESDIWTIHPDGTGLHQVTRLGRCDYPKWSPDGSQILFVRHRTVKKTERSEVWTVKPDGTGLHRLLAVNGVIAADWSPDGQEIALVRLGGTAPALTVQLWTVRPDGSQLRRLGPPLPGSDATVDW